MQTLWSRAAQARSSCRCPTCSFRRRTAPRRGVTASVAHNMCSSSTGFAVSFSTAVVGASYLDARSKQIRRQKLDQSISDARAEVRELIEDQEARMRALEERFGNVGLRPSISTDEDQKKMMPDSRPVETELLKLRKVYGTLNKQALGTEDQATEHKPAISGSFNTKYKELLDKCMGILASQQSMSKPVQDQYSAPQFNFSNDSWGARLKRITDPRVALIMMGHMSRLIHQFEIFQLYLNTRPERNQTSKIDNAGKDWELESQVAHSLDSMQRIDFWGRRMASYLREISQKDASGEDRVDEGVNIVYRWLNENEDSRQDLKVVYMHFHSPQQQAVKLRKQEEDLLKIFDSSMHPAEILAHLRQFLMNNEFAPTINMFNLMIIRLCDHGLPCAANMVLECLRRCPLKANAVTDEAALRCALLEQDEEMFLKYYSSMKGTHGMGWHPLKYETKLQELRDSTRIPWGSSPASSGIGTIPITQGAAEAVIRNYLRQRRLRLALEEYAQFLQKGWTPSSQLMESFLRGCYAIGDAAAGWEIWQQTRTIFERPSSAAYYWILHLLAASTEGRTEHIGGEPGSALFDRIAKEMAKLYDMPNPLTYKRFCGAGSQRTRLILNSDEIEELSVRQWVPGRSCGSCLLPDLLTLEREVRKSRRIWPKTLPHFMARQRDLLRRHFKLEDRVHTTQMLQNFLRKIVMGSVDLSARYEGVKLEKLFVSHEVIRPTIREAAPRDMPITSTIPDEVPPNAPIVESEEDEMIQWPPALDLGDFLPAPELTLTAVPRVASVAAYDYDVHDDLGMRVSQRMAIA